jgi:hypothetical protein
MTVETPGREYAQGVASLGFSGGPSVRFRLNPEAVDWNFQINTAVIETVGGRVVQVLGATPSDLVIRGSFGEVRGSSHTESWTMAEQFLTSIKAMAEYQARDARRQGAMNPPAIFNFPAKGWRMGVYIKSFTDADGAAAITHRPGRFSYDYILTLMIDSDLSGQTGILGTNNGVLNTMKDKAIASYIARISDGIGWHFSQYNGHGIAEAAAAVGTGRDGLAEKP